MKEGERLGRWEGEIKPERMTEERRQITEVGSGNAEVGRRKVEGGRPGSWEAGKLGRWEGEIKPGQRAEMNEFGSRNAACDELSRIEVGKRRSA